VAEILEVVMSKTDVVRAWRDREYRASLSSDELAMLPPNPAGELHMSDVRFHRASGPSKSNATTAWFCTNYTFRVGCCH